MRKYLSDGSAIIYQGDPVELTSTGKVKVMTTVAGTDNIVGVAASYTGATTNNEVWVYDDPYTIFECQSDGTTDPGSSTAWDIVGNLVDFVTTDGNTTTKVSKYEIDYSSKATTGVHSLRIVGLFDHPNNDSSLSHANYLVMFNRHLHKSHHAGTTAV
jgi:hypothetical protein